MLPTPHDAYFKRIFGEPVNAIEHFRAHLPIELTSHLELNRLEVLPGSFVDEELRQHHSDLLFAVPLAGRDARLHLIFEHKSTSDRLTAWQVSRYVQNIWSRHAQALKAEGKTMYHLPPVIPVVLYHGEERWSAPRALSELLDAPPSLAPTLRKFGAEQHYQLMDLSTMPNLLLKGTAVARSLMHYHGGRPARQKYPSIPPFMGSPPLP